MHAQGNVWAKASGVKHTTDHIVKTQHARIPRKLLQMSDSGAGRQRQPVQLHLLDHGLQAVASGGAEVAVQANLIEKGHR